MREQTLKETKCSPAEGGQGRGNSAGVSNVDSQVHVQCLFKTFLLTAAVWKLQRETTHYSTVEGYGMCAQTKPKQGSIHHQHGGLRAGDAAGALRALIRTQQEHGSVQSWSTESFVPMGELPSVLHPGAAGGCGCAALNPNGLPRGLGSTVKVISATDPPLPWGFRLTEIYKLGTLCQFPVPRKSN